MANDFKTMFDGVMSLIGNIDDEEKGVQSRPVPLIAGSGGNIPQPPKAPVAAPQGDYFSGMFPEVPKDPLAPQAVSDFIDTSGAVGGLGHVPSVPAIQDSPQMVPTERVPRTPKELKEFDDLVFKNKNNQNSISELNPFVNQEREAAVKKMEWEVEAKAAEERAGQVDVPSMLTPQQEELQGTLPQLERDIPQVELEPLQPQEDLVQVEIVTADEADSSAVEIGAENAAVVDEEIAKGDPEDPNFLQKLWGGIKGTVKGGFEDPAIRRSLFAYAASRAMGYDGATLAVQVLENEWRKEAATAQTDAANARAFGKSEATRIAKARDASSIDYKNGTEIYDSQTKTNIKGTWSKDGQTFNPNDASVFAGADGVAVPSVSAAALMQMQGGRYSAGRGETRSEALEKYRDSGSATLVQLKNDKVEEYDANEDMNPKDKGASLSRINAGTQPHVMEEALVAIQARYPNADLNTPAGRTVFNRTAAKWVDALADGSANGSKDFVGFYNREIMEKRMKQGGSLRDNVFKVHGTDLDSGMNAYTTTESQIKRIATGVKGDKPADVWILALKGYETASQNVGSGFKARWEAASEESENLGKSEMMSPELAWVQSLSPPELRAMVDRQRLL